MNRWSYKKDQMTDHNYNNDELISAVISQVLERMNVIEKPSLSWFQMIAAHNGKITKPEIVAHANKLLDDILIDEFGSLEGYQKFLDKQQKMYEDYVKQVDKNQKQYVPTPVVEEPPKKTTKPTRKTRNTPVTHDVKPSPIADKIGVKRRNKNLDEIAKEAGYESVESYLFWNRNNR